jgi:ABC-type multidrug transport system fused ATPase/permease subunit
MRHPLLRLIPLFNGAWGWVIAATGGLLLGTGLNLAGPWLVSQAIDVDLPAGDIVGLQWRAAAYLGVVVSTFALTYAARLGIEWVAQRAMVRLKNQLFDHLVEHDLALHDTHPSGTLITRVQGDTEALRVLLSEVVLAAPADTTLLVGMFAVIMLNAPDIALPVFGVLPLYGLALAVFRKVAPRFFLTVRKVRSELTGQLTELVRALPLLRGMDRIPWALQRQAVLDDRMARAQIHSGLVPVVYFNGVVGIRALGIVSLLLWGSLRIAEGSLSVGALVLGLGYLRLLFDPLMRLSHHLTTVERARAAAIRIAELLDTAPKITDPPHPLPWPGLTDALRFEDVSFHYVEGSPVLSGLSLSLPAGSRIGVVGATGAGKSTVLALVMRFRDPVSGRVTVDGVDLRDVAVDDVRRKFGLVLQDVHLFPGTVLDNLGGDRAAATRALDTLGLEFDLDSPVEAGLSRGERQLLTFARALVDDPEILVLDEATSAVDPATEARVQEALGRLLAGRTTLIVAHRLATVRDCDRIVVLGREGVQEEGTHTELLVHGGTYAALAQLQGAA